MDTEFLRISLMVVVMTTSGFLVGCLIARGREAIRSILSEFYGPPDLDFPNQGQFYVLGVGRKGVGRRGR